VAWRIGTLLALSVAVAWALQRPDSLALTLVVAGLMVWGIVDLFNLVERTNHEVARLITCLRHGDFSQSFESAAVDAGFGDLSRELEQLIAMLRAESTQTLAENHQLNTLIDHIPICLLCINANEQVTLLNNAARRQFAQTFNSRLASFEIYGKQFVEGIRQLAGEGIVVFSAHDDATLKMRATVSVVTYRGQLQRLIALQPIQAALDENEMTLSRKLVQVLTHEIMNSLTPITSLAKSAERLAHNAPQQAIGRELRDAIQTIERRADGLMQFAERYREITRAPHVHAAAFAASTMVSDLNKLVRAEWPSNVVIINTNVEPSDLEVVADRQLLEHVLLNLLRNAIEACVGVAQAPEITLSMRRSPTSRTLIDVCDNGNGIPGTMRDDVFLPFFTSKPNGNGVGLSVSRQIVLAHGGSIRVVDSLSGGACLRIVL
jgi:nitrogen fixation/metabolism regulation signal transduction histidine kinase